MKRRRYQIPIRNLKVLDDRGESVGESLASILIVALSTMLLLSCVMTAAENDKAAERVDAAHYAALSEAEARADAVPAPIPTPGKVTITGDSTSVPLDIEIYGEGVFSYKRG